jgi:predicted HicB family RNase H-like nuclease
MDDANEKPAAPKNRGGRPRSAEGSRLTTWLPAQTHDRLIKTAAEREQSVSSLVRQVLTRRFPS